MTPTMDRTKYLYELMWDQPLVGQAIRLLGPVEFRSAMYACGVYNASSLKANADLFRSMADDMDATVESIAAEDRAWRERHKAGKDESK